MASSNTTIVRPDSAKLKALGDWALAEIKSGSSPVVVADAVTAKYPGVSMHDIFPKGDLGKRPKSLTDMARSVLQGLTMGSADEGAGAIGAMTGGDYSTVRDAFRADDARFQQQHAGTDAALRMTGAAIPAAAMMMIPGMQPQAGAFLANTARGAVGGGVLGAATGAGESTAPTMGGVVRDAAKSGAVGTVVGGVMGGTVPALMAKARGTPSAAVTAVEDATAALAPRPGDVSTVHGGPIDLKSVMQKRAAIVPSAVVPADADPGIQTLLGTIGADPKIAATARSQAMQRVVTIGKEAQQVGKAYDPLRKQFAPVDGQLERTIRDAAIATGANKQLGLAQVNPKALQSLKTGELVNLGDLQEMRKVINANARKLESSGANPTLLSQYRAVADRITDRLRPAMPDIDAVDQQYAILSDWKDAAQSTHDAIQSSIQQFAKRSLVKEAPTINVQIPLRMSGVGTAVSQTVKAAVGGGPTPAQQAQALYRMLLTPNTADETANIVSTLQMFGRQPTRFPAAGLMTQGAAALTGQQMSRP